MEAGVDGVSCMTLQHQYPRANEDVLIAREICEHLNIPHKLIPQPLTYLKLEIEKNKITNFCSRDPSTFLPLSSFLQNEGYSVIFDGIAGDVLSASSTMNKDSLDLYRNKKFEELANKYLDNSEEHLRKFLSKTAYKRFSRNLAFEILVDELKKHAEAPNPIGQFFFWNRTRREVSLHPYRVLAKSCHVLAPYLDSALYKFLSSVPAEYLLDRTFHQKAIEARYPEYAHLPYETRKAHPQKQSYRQNLLQLSEYISYLISNSFQEKLYNLFRLYPKLLFGLISPKYYEKTCNLYKLPVYLTELYKLSKRS